MFLFILIGRKAARECLTRYSDVNLIGKIHGNGSAWHYDVWFAEIKMSIDLICFQTVKGHAEEYVTSANAFNVSTNGRVDPVVKKRN